MLFPFEQSPHNFVVESLSGWMELLDLMMTSLWTHGSGSISVELTLPSTDHPVQPRPLKLEQNSEKQ